MLYLLVFTPVIVGGAAALALLLGAGTVAAWETFEGRTPARPMGVGPALERGAPAERPHSRAA
jgi:hypothetical protein